MVRPAGVEARAVGKVGARVCVCVQGCVLVKDAERETAWPAREEKGIGSDVGDVPCRTALCQLPGTCGRVPWACAGPVLAPDGDRAGATSAWLVTYWAVHSSGTAARVQPEAAAGWLPSDG